KIARALVELDWKADTQPLHQLINDILVQSPAATKSVSESWLYCTLAERDAAGARNALLASGENFGFTDDVVQFPHAFLEAIIARMAKDQDKARAAFAAARSEQEKTIQAQPNYGRPLCVLGLIEAGLGRKEEALQEGRRAVELLAGEEDARTGS